MYTRHFCSLFDVSHMGRVLVEGGGGALPAACALQQRALPGLEPGPVRHHPTPSGGAVDDAYLYRFEADRYLLVVNAANTDKDLAHLQEQIQAFDAKMTVITGDVAAIAVQGPKAKELLMALSGGEQVTEPVKNALNTLSFEGRTVRVAKTGYTGEPIGYEVYIESSKAVALEPPGGTGGPARGPGRPGHPAPGGGPAPLRPRTGRRPGGAGDPVYAVPVAKFAVSFSEQKGDFIGRAALAQQYDAYKRIMDRDFPAVPPCPGASAPSPFWAGASCAPACRLPGEEQIGWVTSGTMVPYYTPRGRAWRP